MKELIKTLIADVIRKIDFSAQGGPASGWEGAISVEICDDKNHGDYSTNVAFGLSKILGKSPKETAENLASKIKSPEFSKIEAVNGFINFFLSENCLHRQLEQILSKTNSKIKNSKIKNFKLNIEFISANPTGPLTIGNGRGGFFGDVLVNILETQGFDVSREYYINDRGVQVLNLGKSIKHATRNKKQGVEDEDNLYKGEYIKDLAEEIDVDLSLEETGRKAVELVLEKYIKPAVKKIGIKFDEWFSESSLYPDLYEEVMKKLMATGYIYEKDGATWLKTSEFWDNEDRVLIKNDGAETYFLSDILYHYDKFKIRKFDKAIDIWGADHHGYAPRLKAAMKILGVPEDSLEIEISQLVRLVKNGEEVKVSKRAGNFVTLQELVDEVGLDAARFFFLMYSLNTHMDFDMDLAKERSQKNPVYYVQYANARITSILQKVKSKNFKFSILNFKLLKEKEELNLIRKLVEYPGVLENIAESYEIQRLPRYTLDLAREFHNFYEKCRVITEDENLTTARLALVSATKIVVGNALRLMGISAPEKM